MSFKRVPDALWTKYGESPVVSCRSYPPNSHPIISPIKREFTALHILCENGESRWFGFERVHINSRLEMIVSGFSPLFEEVNKYWPDGEED